MAMTSSDSLPENLHLYVGFVFTPTDHILLQDYLFNKIHGLPYSRAVVFDCDLYGADEPWDIWRHFQGVDGTDLYFFTKLKRSTNNSGQSSAHISRKIGSAGGTWSGENSATPVFADENDDDEIIGYCKRFRYENPQLPEHHGEWIMHEYSLHEKLISNCPDPNYVLCRMRKNERPKRKAEKRCFSKIESMKKNRVMAPKVNDIENNERPKRKAKKGCLPESSQPSEQRVVAPEMIYNKPCEHAIPINQFTSSDVSHMRETIINQGTNDVSSVHHMAIDQCTTNAPCVLEMSTTNQGTNDVPYGHDMTNDELDLWISEMYVDPSTNVVC